MVGLWLLIIAYCLTFGVLSILQHNAFGTSIYDLGNVDQAVWNTLHGRILQFTTQPRMGDIRLSMHIEPILLPISLLYLIYSSPKTLLIVQTLAIGLGAWPLFLIARRKLRSGWSALAFSAAYLLLPALEAANLFEFHAVVIAPVFLLFTFYFAEKTPGKQPLTRYLPVYGFALLAMSCKEDIPLLIFTMGLYFVVARKWESGFPLLVLGSLWFYIAIYVVYPAVRQGDGSPFMRYYQDFGDNPLAIVSTLLTHPQLTANTLLTRDNLNYTVGLLFPFGFLPILGLPTLLIAAPSIGINLLSSFPLMHELEAKQYPVPIVPFVALSAVYGTYYFSRWVKKERLVIYATSVLVLICALTYHHFRGFSPLSLAYKPPQVTMHHKLADDFIRAIPPEAPLIAQDRLFPHVSQRERAYYVWTTDTDADYVFLDVSHPSFVNTGNVHQWLKDQIDAQDDFGLIKARDGYLLLQRGAARADLPDEFYTFAHVEDPRIEYPVAVDFGDTLRLLGYDIVYDRDREVNFVLYWQLLHPVERDYAIQLHLVDAEGDIVASTSTPQPTLVWYPTSKWRPAGVVRVVANTAPWSTQELETYGVAVGVSYDDSTNGQTVDLLPRVQANPHVTRILANGRLLELARFRKRWGIQQAIFDSHEFSRPHVDHEIGASFGQFAVLEGMSTRSEQPVPGRDVNIELIWHPLTSISESFTVFVHLIDSSGKIWGQRDSVPQQGTRPTTAWVSGEYIRDNYTIPVPEDAASESLRLAIGLYRGDTGERVAVTDEKGTPVDDHVTIGLQ